LELGFEKGGGDRIIDIRSFGAITLCDSCYAGIAANVVPMMS
jgi:hypothetical protein